ncbi:MAG: tol-pal system protein YbgF [Rhodospirillales bacterium]|nr:tol-pal system protein YbgF [Rhodospirillales bacterium]
MVLASVLFAAPGYAQYGDPASLRNRVEQLEQQLKALQGGTGGGPAAARMEVRQSESEEELRALTGRVEDLNYQVQQLSEKLDKLAADIDYRLNQAGAPQETQPGATPSLMPPPPPSPAEARQPGPVQGSSGQTVPGREPRPLGSIAPGAADAAGAPAETPKQEYAQAYDLLRRGQYEQAASAFSAFLDRHPSDPLAENARYWLGESFYARGDYARAVDVFVQGYQANKTGAKAPDTLLKLGMSLSALGKAKEACATFRELAKAFPDASPAVKEKEAQESRRAGCS